MKLDWIQVLDGGKGIQVIRCLKCNRTHYHAASGSDKAIPVAEIVANSRRPIVLECSCGVGVSPAGADLLHPYGVALVSGIRRPFLRAGHKINAKYFSALATPLVLKAYENKSQRRNRSFIHS